MTPNQVIKHYGTQLKAAQAIGCTQPTISAWKKNGAIPCAQQIRIQGITGGALKADRKSLARFGRV